MKTRKEEPVKNNPGIYRILSLDPNTGLWKMKGYRAVRWIKENGLKKKEQAVFQFLEEAQEFRNASARTIPSAALDINSSGAQKERYTFWQLIEEWKPFHFLKLARGTKAVYEKLLPHLDYLKHHNVEDIKVSAIDELIKFWITEYPKSSKRQHFDKELDLLTAILNFYRRRKNQAFVIPIFPEHRQAANVTKRVKQKVKSLTQEDLIEFLQALKNGSTPQYHPVALAQFCLGLRIGEACGLMWDSLNLENRVASITFTVDWDQKTWEPYIKEKPKNGHERILVIPKVLVKELEELKLRRDPNVPLVFHRNGIPYNRKTIATAYNKTLKKLGISYVSGTHMLRKTAATQANRITGDFYAVSKLMDHSSPNITLRYVEEVSDQKRKVADALNSVLDTMGGEKDKKQNEPVSPQNPTNWDRPKLTLVKSVR